MKDKTRCVRHSMTILLVLITGYTALAYNQSQNQGKKKRRDGPTSIGFFLVAQAEKDVIAVGEPLKLGLTIRNASSRVRFIIETFVTEQYRLTVFNEREKPVRLTKYGEMELQPLRDHYGNALKALRPGEESRNTIEVNKLYDMSTPGTYSITAWRIIYDKDAKEVGSVQSNRVRLKVTK